MTGKLRTLVIALLGIFALANHAHANCGSSKRVSASDSECLAETHSNSRYTVTNHCLHEIKAKIDIKNGSDKTETVAAARLQSCTQVGEYYNCTDVHIPEAAHWATTLTPTSTSGSISTSWGRKIRSVTCCKDYTSCNRRSTERYPP